MPTFSNKIPEDPRGQSFPIVRTPIAHPLTAIVTSEDLVGTYTHYYKGRTAPCEQPDCEPCRDGLPYRWHNYLSAYQLSKGLHFLFECTAKAGEPFIEYRKKYNTLRGCMFESQRYSNKPNGRVLIRCKPADLQGILLPKPPHLIRALCILWNVPFDELADPELDVKHRPREVQKDR